MMLTVETTPDGVAVLTMGGEGVSPWGTKLEEHRLNTEVIAAVENALDRVLADPNVRALMVTGEGKFFCNGLDLKWIEAHPDEAEGMQQQAEKLLARLLVFPLPTIAGINGHFCAAGGMLGLSFDCRVMNADRGLFFVPAIDLGIVYTPGMTELLKEKTPPTMHRDVIVFGKRYNAGDLLSRGVVDAAVPAAKVRASALAMATELTAKGQNATYRRAMHGIKLNLYASAHAQLMNSVASMGFENKPKGMDRPARL
jgi:enoyl-CoA hydratase/carnithine racemase